MVPYRKIMRKCSSWSKLVRPNFEDSTKLRFTARNRPTLQTP